MSGLARIVLGAVAFAAILVSSQAARSEIVLGSPIFVGREILLGCTQPTCTSGSTNATAETLSVTEDTLRLRFGLNVNADDAAGGGVAIENGVAIYHVDFTVSLDNFALIISTSRKGALRRNADALGCEGSVAVGEVQPTLLINGAAGPDLSQLVLPAASIDNGGGDRDLEIDTAVRGQTVPNRTIEDTFSLRFSVSAIALSDSCEVSARFGAPNAATTGCSACEYPGDGDRDIELDGLFVTITVVDLCGDGALQAPEQCDLGEFRNGVFGECCGSDCRFEPATSACRNPGASAACDPAEMCSGSGVACPADAKAPAGTACEDDGDPCTADMCNDGGGQCLHIPVPLPCPALCGNGQVDPGEDCDFGAIDNGAPTNCCDETCRNRPNGASCTDEAFCNGEESCTEGVCESSTGNPCSELGACAVCDEVNNLCDTSGCAATPTASGTPSAATPTPTFASATPTGTGTPTATSPPTPVASDELVVNTYTTRAQNQPAIASLAGGDFVVVWRSDAQDGDDYGIFGQRLDDDGARLGTEFAVNTTTAGEQRDPEVVGKPDGGFAVVWEDDEDRILVRLFASSGAAASSEIQVNTTTGILTEPAIAADAAGRMVVAWNRNDHDVYAQRLDSAGAAIGTELVVSTTSTGAQEGARVASDAEGDFVVVWLRNPPIGNVGIFAQRYQSSGAPAGTEFQIATETLGRPDDLSVSADPDGGFVLAYTARPNNIRAQRFDGDGMPLGSEILVAGGAVDVRNPDVAIDPRGHFVVVWEAQVDGNDEVDVFGRRYTSDGSEGEPFQANQFTADRQGSPVAASGADGSFVVAWSSYAQDGDLDAVVARRFACDASSCLVCVGNCNGDGRVEIGELIIGVNIALGLRPLDDCRSFDANGNGAVQVAELIRAVNNALNGCS